MKKQYCSPVAALVHETAEGLAAARVMSKQTMREFDELCVMRTATRGEARAGQVV
jgi:DNA-binding transcriptional regulator YiaG